VKGGLCCSEMVTVINGGVTDTWVSFSQEGWNWHQ
jgi:hypothetical protein